MFTQEELKATGKLHIVVRDENGNIKEEKNVTNLVVAVGKNFIAGRMKDTGIPSQMSHMAVGAGTSTPVVGDTTLGSELGRTTLTTAGGTVSNNVVTYAATFGAGVGTGAITEAGILNASSSGTLLCRTTFAVVNKGANDSMSITWTVTIS